MLFAVATPMHMMAPISAGTLSARVGEEQEEHNARQRSGQSRNDDERIDPALKINDDQQVDQHDGKDEPAQQTDDMNCASFPPAL